MKKNQDGFIGVAFAIAFAAIGVATVAVQESNRAGNATIHTSQMAREREKLQNSALNAAARYKGLLMERKNPATGEYIPGIYAVDYFAKPEDWIMRKSVAIGGSGEVLMVGTDQRTVQIKAGTSTATVLGKSTEVFNQQVAASSVQEDLVDVEIANLKLAEPGEPGAGILVKYADIRVQGLQLDGQKATPIVVRVPVPKPIPFNLKVFYRPTGDPTWVNFTSDVTLPDGGYEFKVQGSGIMTGVKFKWDGTDIFLGFNPATGEIEHMARNYEAANIQIGPILGGDFTLTEKLDKNTCSVAAVDNTHTVEVSMIGVDGKDYESTGSMKMKLSTSTKVLTLNDYRTQCLDKCAYLETTSRTSLVPGAGIDAGDISEWWVNDNHSNNTTIPDISGEWTFQETSHYKISNKKLCVSFLGVSPTDFGGLFFKAAKFKAYTVPGCAVEFLGARDSCGCVAEDTKILMGDGKSEKRIDEIVQGETIWNPLLKKAMPIRKMTRGPEKVPMLKITVGDQMLSVTGNHPFPTKSGMKTAFSLSKGEEIMMEGKGWQAIASIDTVEASGKAPDVWNIEVEAPNENNDAHHYVANGVVTGDLMIQKKLQSQAQTAQN
ncbi:MAG: hypothetical protein H7318_11125 [Oligoflexus sp.]|nr:hypothetical protein [Oligoflexus sp.]